MKQFLLSLSVFLTPAIAQAWNFRYVGDAPIRWHSSNNTVGFKLQNFSFPTGSAVRGAFQVGFDSLNQNPSNIRMVLNPDTTWVSVGNGQNEIWFTDNTAVVSSDRPAVCISHFNPFAFGVWNLMESDVIFNPRENYVFSADKALHLEYGGDRRSMRTVTAHEIGHALGLQHESRIYNVMGRDWQHTVTNGPRVSSARGEDASTGLVSVYGSAGPIRGNVEDLGVSHWRYSYAAGEYSSHDRTSIYRPTTPLTFAPLYRDGSEGPDPDQYTYGVNSGDIVLAEFTIENNGRTPQDVEISYYISTNNVITTRDMRIRRIARRHVVPDRPSLHRDFVLIPEGLPRDTRMYLGIVIDSNNAVTETNENNNATFIPIQVNH